MKNLIIKKSIRYPLQIVALSLLISISSYGQTRELKDVIVSELNFTHSLATVESEKEKHVLVELDRKLVKNISRVFFKIGTKAHYGDVKSGVIDLEVLEGKKTDKKFKVKKYNKDSIKLDLGAIEPGNYYLVLRIMDVKKNMYVSLQQITQ